LSVGSPPVNRILLARGLRGVADGFISVLLARYLTNLGFSPVEVGAIVTGTLLGSAVLTIAFGFSPNRVPLRSLLLAASVVMVATGLGFAAFTAFWPMVVVAVVGTLNPSAGDVSVFLPTEQALLAGETPVGRRPAIYARYGVVGTVAAACGALVSGAPEAVAGRMDVSVLTAQRAGFVLYAGIGLVVLVVYRSLPAVVEPVVALRSRTRRGLHRSRRTVLELAGLFAMDSAAGGFVVTSMLVLWLDLRFGLSARSTASVFFVAGLLGGLSQFLAPRLAARIGLIRTMAFTHLPANLLLVLAAFAPTGVIAVALLLARSLLSQMDVPARQAFVMAVVPAEERAAAASVTNVPRSLASAATPVLAGSLLASSTFGWPLLIAGVAKATYDLLLLGLYRSVPEVEGAARRRR
jgi:MFS family permease